METVLPLVAAYGAALLLVVTFLSCLALPVPASLAMLAAGAFAASGDLSLTAAVAAALAGAVAGDQAGYWAARRGGGPMLERLAAQRRSGPLLRRARAALAGRLWASVFLSRWLFSPLGPWVNLAGGAARLPWRPFTAASVAGEALWVGLYVGAGYVFAAQIDDLGKTLGAGLGLLAAMTVSVLLGRLVWSVVRQRRTAQRSADVASASQSRKATSGG
jgi:membrane protein DedA with SNARE-associated domain